MLQSLFLIAHLVPNLVCFHHYLEDIFILTNDMFRTAWYLKAMSWISWRDQVVLKGWAESIWVNASISEFCFLRHTYCTFQTVCLQETSEEGN